MLCWICKTRAMLVVFGSLHVNQMVTLEASYQSPTLRVYKGITMPEINHCSESFKSALSKVVKRHFGKSNMLLPPTPSMILHNFFMPKQDIRKRMKMQVVVAQMLYAERHVLFTANSKGATIPVDLANLARAASLGVGAMVSNRTHTHSYNQLHCTHHMRISQREPTWWACNKFEFCCLCVAGL